MAIKQGWDGAVYIGTTAADTDSTAAANLNSWTINWAGDALENTDYGDKDRTYQPGLRNVTIDFAGNYEAGQYAADYLTDNFKSASTNTAAAIYCLTVRTTGAKAGWYGSGPITALTVGGAVDGLVPLSGTIQISGGLSTYAT
jgi:hypothetical protein